MERCRLRSLVKSTSVDAGETFDVDFVESHDADMWRVDDGSAACVC